MANYIVRTGSNGNGITHLFPAETRQYKIHGIVHTGTGKALCGAIASAAAVDWPDTHETMPVDATKPCEKCSGKTH